ncbi:MAG: hypothetical protein GXP32_04020 [Kiritimatiellaeota bacterium]|nr:hypothetical protein [Kiritimatiellota bacterium]
MLPIHIAIGTIEGIATAAVLILLKESEPGLFGRFEGGETAPAFGTRFKRTIIGIALTALFMGSVLAWFASEKPDGLEWSISKIMGGEELADTAGGVKSIAGRVQKASSLFPDYRVGVAGDSDAAPPVEWGGADASASVAGMAGVLITLSLSFSLGLFFRKRKNPNVPGRS